MVYYIASFADTTKVYLKKNTTTAAAAAEAVAASFRNYIIVI